MEMSIVTRCQLSGIEERCEMVMNQLVDVCFVLSSKKLGSRESEQQPNTCE